MATNIRIRSVTGPAIEEWIPALARLRIGIFREFPYLYDGNEDYERRYLQTYTKTDTSIAVLAIAGDEVVGASTGLAMADEESAFIRPFSEAGYGIDTIFYCAESVLLPAFRSQGIYRHFFEEREKHALSLGGITLSTFCAVQRPDNHPLRPQNYISLDNIWRHFGYRPRPELTTQFDWKDVDEQASSPKPMAFYTKALS